MAMNRSWSDDPSEPSRFVDTIDIGRHELLFYEDEEYGLMLQFRFINTGLLKGQHCIYTTHGDTAFIENKMRANGIDVEGFKRKNLLRIYQIPNPMDDPEGVLRGAQNIAGRMIVDSGTPYRIVSRMMPELNTDEERSAELLIERNFQTLVGNLQCSWICPYFIEKMEPSTHARWFLDTLECHQDAIFAPKLGKGIAFKMR